MLFGWPLAAPHASRAKAMLITGILLSLLSACGSQVVGAGASKAKTLRMMVGGEPKNLNRVVQTTSALDPIVVNVMEPLTDLDKDGKPVARLATQWDHSADLTQWQFTLRKGVKFQDGSDFGAKDVVDTAKWAIDEAKVSFVYSKLPFKDAVAKDD